MCACTTGIKAYDLILNVPFPHSDNSDESTQSVREKILAPFPKNTPKTSLNEVLDWVRTLLLRYMHAFVEVDDDVVGRFFGSDAVLQQHMQMLCTATILFVSGIVEKVYTYTCICML